MLNVQTILHPTDYSEGSRYALEVAKALAKEGKARLIVMHAMAPVVIGWEVGVIGTPAWDEKLKDKVYLRELTKDMPSSSVEHHIFEGDAAESILKVAEETPCDLIVMGTHGRTGLNRMLMGSVAEEVIRRAPCPVLTVKHPAVVSSKQSAQPGKSSCT